MSQFTIKQHEKMMRLIIDTAKKTKKETFYVALKDAAKIYDFMNLLWDEEEMEFVLEDIFVDFTEMKLVGTDADDGSVNFDGCGIIKPDYRGDGRNLFFTIEPGLFGVKNFRLEQMEEYVEEDKEDTEDVEYEDAKE